jgi:hypothetical protein
MGTIRSGHFRGADRPRGDSSLPYRSFPSRRNSRGQLPATTEPARSACCTPPDLPDMSADAPGLVHDRERKTAYTLLFLRLTADLSRSSPVRSEIGRAGLVRAVPTGAEWFPGGPGREAVVRGREAGVRGCGGDGRCGDGWGRMVMGGW